MGKVLGLLARFPRRRHRPIGNDHQAGLLKTPVSSQRLVRRSFGEGGRRGFNNLCHSEPRCIERDLSSASPTSHSGGEFYAKEGESLEIRGFNFLLRMQR